MVHSPLCWQGGKHLLKKRIVAMMPEHTRYVEPFVGGGQVFFAKETSKQNVINDKKKELMSFYRNLRDTPCQQVEKCKLPKNKSQFDKMKTRTDVCSFVGVNKRSAFCGMESFSESVAKEHKNGSELLKKNCEEIRGKLKNTKIMNEDYKKIVKKFDSKNTLFYMDPPYWKTSQGGDYAENSNKVDPKDVCGLVKGLMGKAILSYNNHPDVKRACTGLNIKVVKSRNNMVKAHTGGYMKKNTELIITNFKPKN